MKKLSRFVKNNTKVLIAFVLGAVIFSGIGITIATTVASSVITYTSNGQSTVEGALNDLYGKADLLNDYKSSYSGYVYWNDNFSDQTACNTVADRVYSANEAPSVYYPNYKYISYSKDYQLFIRSIFENGSPIDHNATCLKIKSSGKTFCLEKNYWQNTALSLTGSTKHDTTETTAVRDALKSAMESALGITVTCSSLGSDPIWCGVNQKIYCGAYYYGEVTCEDYNTGKYHCNVEPSTGTGSCTYC